ncbi:B12-binding domain-containing radical SAM protein [Chloroflexota bacterium]
MVRDVLLINTNVVRPPVSPIGLEYVGESLIMAGVPVRVLDLSFEPDWEISLQRELKSAEPLAVGLSVRNTDDCSFASGQSFLPWIRDVVTGLRKLTGAPVFLGGGGFSTMPAVVLGATQADFGIEGDGEEAASALANALMRGESFVGLPNMVYWRDGDVVRNPRAEVDLRYLPAPRRRLFDNRRYEQLGAMVGVETKRGCAQRCIFCADPVAKGKTVRLRPPEIVVQELQDLLEQGISWLHLCDSEFNLPLSHAKEVCRAIIEQGLGDRVKWYCYCCPVPFDKELISLMKNAGCVGINFGVDSLCDEQLHRLGRTYSSEDVYRLVRLLNDEGFNYMFDLLIGGPGETAEMVSITIDKAKEFGLPLVGISLGVRIYPGTLIEKAVADGLIKEGLYPDKHENPEQPLFYLSPALGSDAVTLVNRLVGDDPRFLVLAAPAEKGSYNYAGDEALSRLIEQGARGAYWDILRRQVLKLG